MPPKGNCRGSSLVDTLLVLNPALFERLYRTDDPVKHVSELLSPQDSESEDESSRYDFSTFWHHQATTDLSQTATVHRRKTRDSQSTTAASLSSYLSPTKSAAGYPSTNKTFGGQPSLSKSIRSDGPSPSRTVTEDGQPPSRSPGRRSPRKSVSNIASVVPSADIGSEYGSPIHNASPGGYAGQDEPSVGQAESETPAPLRTVVRSHVAAHLFRHSTPVIKRQSASAGKLQSSTLNQTPHMSSIGLTEKLSGGDISGMESSPSLSARNSGAQSRNVDRLKNLKKSGSAAEPIETENQSKKEDVTRTKKKEDNQVVAVGDTGSPEVMDTPHISPRQQTSRSIANITHNITNSDSYVVVGKGRNARSIGPIQAIIDASNIKYQTKAADSSTRRSKTFTAAPTPKSGLLEIDDDGQVEEPVSRVTDENTPRIARRSKTFALEKSVRILKRRSTLDNATRTLSPKRRSKTFVKDIDVNSESSLGGTGANTYVRSPKRVPIDATYVATAHIESPTSGSRAKSRMTRVSDTFTSADDVAASYDEMSDDGIDSARRNLTYGPASPRKHSETEDEYHSTSRRSGRRSRLPPGHTYNESILFAKKSLKNTQANDRKSGTFTKNITEVLHACSGRDNEGDDDSAAHSDTGDGAQNGTYDISPGEKSYMVTGQRPQASSGSRSRYSVGSTANQTVSVEEEVTLEPMAFGDVDQPVSDAEIPGDMEDYPVNKATSDASTLSSDEELESDVPNINNNSRRRESSRRPSSVRRSNPRKSILRKDGRRSSKGNVTFSGKEKRRKSSERSSPTKGSPSKITVTRKGKSRFSVYDPELPTISGSPQHYNELTTTKKAPTEKRIRDPTMGVFTMYQSPKLIKPESPGDSGLRRSRRTRCPRLRYYAGEGPKYKLNRKTGFYDLVGIQGPNPANDHLLMFDYALYTKKQKKKQNGSKKKKNSNLSIHVADIGSDVSDSDGEVVVNEDGEEISAKKTDTGRHAIFYDLSGNVADDSCPVRISKLLQEEHSSSGHLLLAAFAEKPESMLRGYRVTFNVVEGAVMLTLNYNKKVLQPGSVCLIDEGNPYTIKNLRRTPAKLFYVTAKM